MDLFVPCLELGATDTQGGWHNPHTPCRVPYGTKGFCFILLLEGNTQDAVPCPVLAAVSWQVHDRKRRGDQETRTPRVKLKCFFFIFFHYKLLVCKRTKVQ